MDWFMDHPVLLALVSAAIAVAYGIWLTTWLLRQPAGNERMQEISGAVQEGASAYLRRQYKTIAVVAIVPFLALGFYDKLGWGAAFGFMIGAVLSAAAGFIGMNVAVRSNVRTAEAARHGLSPALNVAFRAGSVTGLLVVGLGLFGVAGYYWVLTDWLRQHADLGDRRPHRPRLRRLADLGVRAARRRHLHEGRRRRRRPRRQDRGGDPRGRPAQPGRDRRQRGRQRRRLRRHGGRPVRDLRGHSRRRDAARHHAARPRRQRDVPLSARARRRLDHRLGDRHVLRADRPRRERDHQRALQGRARGDAALRDLLHPGDDGLRRRPLQLLGPLPLGPHRPDRDLPARRDHRVLYRHPLEPRQVDREGLADRSRDEHHRGSRRRHGGDRPPGDRDRLRDPRREPLRGPLRDRRRSDGAALDDRPDRRARCLRPGHRQRGRDRRDGRPARERARDHRPARRGRQHDQGGHEGLRDRLGRRSPHSSSSTPTRKGSTPRGCRRSSASPTRG